MRSLSAHDLLQIWEAAEDQHPLDRALTILAAAHPELSWNELAGLSIGQRDARLLVLRERISGSKLEGFVECPRCAEDLEFEVKVADLHAPPPEEREESWEFAIEGLSIRFRLPNSLDLGAATACPDPATARSVLVQRCVLQASRDGLPVVYGDLPAEAISELGQHMAERDPQAEVMLDLRCPTCDHGWQALFDVVTFFWYELTAQVRRLLREVHTLARAYGWSEADILSMNARRRQSYLEMVT